MPTAPAAFGRRLYLLGQNWRREVDSRMRAFGLTDATWRPLLQLGREGDGMRQTDLATALEIEASSLVRLLDTLCAAGLVARHAEPSDRRSKCLWLTPAGQALYVRVAGEYDAVARSLLAEAAEEDLDACSRVFEAVERAMARLARDRGRPA